MVRAIAYIRVSTDRQATDGTSLVTQRRRVIEFTALKGYRLVKQFVEEGESAKTDNRPVLKQMLRYCEEQKGKIDLLVVPKIDRFARYSEDYHHLKRHLRNLGIRVESIDERFDDSPAGKFLESMLAATAQFDNDVRSERTFNGMREAVSQGRWVWRAPAGYRNVRIDGKANIEPDPRTGPLVIEAFEKIARKIRIAEVREWLNEHGVPIQRNGFYKMIRNKAYIGIIEAFGVKSRGVLPFTPLISVELFEAAQAAVAPSNHPRVTQRDHEDFPLRGTIRCQCGQFLTACWSRGRRSRYAYYRCRQCSRVNLPREFVEHQFLHRLRFLRSEFDLSDEMATDLRAFWEQERSHYGKLVEELRKERERIESQQKSLAWKVADAVVPDHLAKQMFEEYDSKLRSIEAKLSKSSADDREPHINILIDYGKRFFEQVESFWQTADVSDKKRVQNFFFPTGAVVEDRRVPRTASEVPVTGGGCFLFGPCVQFGGPQRQKCEHDALRRRVEFFRELYSTFGGPIELASQLSEPLGRDDKVIPK